MPGATALGRTDLPARKRRSYEDLLVTERRLFVRLFGDRGLREFRRLIHFHNEESCQIFLLECGLRCLHRTSAGAARSAGLIALRRKVNL